MYYLEHSYSDSSNLIGQFEVSYFHSDTDDGCPRSQAMAFLHVVPSLLGHAPLGHSY